MWSTSAHVSSFAGLSGRRAFSMRRKARKRRRLDEYDRFSAPVRARVWRQVIEKKDFLAYKWEEMTAAEVSTSIFLASKMGVKNSNFWDRAALAAGDLAAVMTPRQLTNVCYAFGLASWQEASTLKALAPAIIRNAGEFRPGDLATLVQSVARSTKADAAVLASVSQAVQQNDRLNCKGFAMIAGAFASARFRSSSFHGQLNTWAAAGGLGSCTLEDTSSLIQSLSLTLSPDSENVQDLLLLLSRRLEYVVHSLEPPALAQVVIAVGKLQMSNQTLLSSLQQKTSREIHLLHANSLPAMLDAFVSLYKSAGGDGVTAEGRAFLAQLTGPLARALRYLRPQDACRACQALDRLGLVDTHLSAGIANLVPSRLNAWPAPALLRLLQAYAAGRNPDGVMLSYIRQAMLPISRWSQHSADNDIPSVIDPAALTQLDDMAVVQTVEAFRLLEHTEGIVAVLAAVQPGTSAAARMLAPSCELALAAMADDMLCSSERWKAAVGVLAASEPHISNLMQEVLTTDEYRSHWHARAKRRAAEADTLLLAVCAFPRHPQHSTWVSILAQLIGKCSTALLPGLLLSGSLQASRREHEDLKDLAEEELVQQLRRSSAIVPGDKAVNGWKPLLPEAASVAALRALARRVADSGVGPGGARMAAIREAAQTLAEGIGSLAETAASTGTNPPSAKAFVRTLHALQNLQVEPSSSLVRHFAAAGATLTATELLFALRLLTAQSIREAQADDLLAALATRAWPLLRSSRQAWELQSICKKLELDIEEVDVAEEPEEETAKPSSQYSLEVERRFSKRSLASRSDAT